MSVFEDLIGELKSENLLEETVIDLKRADTVAEPFAAPVPGQKKMGGASVSTHSAADANAFLGVEIPESGNVQNDLEYFRKRATDEVSSLQMVENLFSGIEREHMKVSSASYDDLNAKKALHKFLQVAENVNSREHAEAEFELRNETEAWNLALYERDQKISVANVRRFCEGSRPALSSQALIALARFYRNSPYSEEVRGKFEYVMTRLFSRENGEELRNLLFGHDEMVGHINTLYANWSSIAIYTKNDDQPEVTLTIARFAEFTKEAEYAKSFDELLTSGFFNRVRAYKEESAEMFYVPEVVAAAIVCNLTVGNRYIGLIGRERAKIGAEKTEEKYGAANDEIVSDLAHKTLLLTDVLALEFEDEAIAEEQPHKRQAEAVKALPASDAKPPEQADERSGFDFSGVNKWLVAACMFCILAGLGVYIWAENFAGGEVDNASIARPVQIDDPDVRKYVQNSRSTTETLYAMMDPSFENLSESEQKEVIVKIQRLASTMNLSRVNLINKKGKTIGFATEGRVEVVK